MIIDAATRANLELTRSLAGEKRGPAFSRSIDRTVTAAGARLLARRLAYPLDRSETDLKATRCGGLLCRGARLREDMRKDLRQFPDIERALSRLALGRGGPRDLAALSRWLADVREALNDRLRQPHGLAALSAELKQAEAVLADWPAAVLADLTAVLADTCRSTRAMAASSRTGYSAELDQHRELRDETRQVIAELQTRLCG